MLLQPLCKHFPSEFHSESFKRPPSAPWSPGIVFDSQGRAANKKTRQIKNRGKEKTRQRKKRGKEKRDKEKRGKKNAAKKNAAKKNASKKRGKVKARDGGHEQLIYQM
jgi:hypothetical protein